MRRDLLVISFFASLATIFGCGYAFAECLSPVLSPSLPGHNYPSPTPTLYDDFLSLVEGIYKFEAPEGPTKTLTIGSVSYLVPPWFGIDHDPNDCQATTLRRPDGYTGPLSFTDYFVDGDELSELMLVTSLANNSLGDNHGRFVAIHNTIQRMIQASAGGELPCVTAHVQFTGPSITCYNGDSASDVTARVTLAYYQAAQNPAFPAASRATYRQIADGLAAHHITNEYFHLPEGQCRTSVVTGRPLCHWVGGGSNTTQSGFPGMEMWIGYHQDIVRMLLAAYRSTSQCVYLERAEEVLEQWLLATEFTNLSDTLSVGFKKYKWSPVGPPVPIDPIDGPDVEYNWKPENPPWDESDAPRILWIGDTIRALLLTGAATSGNLPVPYLVLKEWVGRIQVASDLLPGGGSRPPKESCIQLNRDGTCYSNAGTDFYYNGLGSGLHTVVNASEAEAKIRETFRQYSWTAPKPTWNSAACFRLYRGVRPVKALASLIGLDTQSYCATTGALKFYTVQPCRLLDTRNTSTPLLSGVPRAITVGGQCGIPPTAKAISVNATIIAASSLGHLSFTDTVCALPGTSTLNFGTGQTRANNAVVRLAPGAQTSFAATATLNSGSVHLVVDVNGYFE